MIEGDWSSDVCSSDLGCGGRIRFVVVIFIYQSDRVVCCSDVSTAGSILFRGCPPALQLCGGVVAGACDRRGLFVYNDGVLIVKGNGDVVGVQTILERLVAPYLIRAACLYNLVKAKRTAAYTPAGAGVGGC